MASWWWGTRRFRLWFALLAPTASVAGVIVAVIGSLSQADGACSPSCGGSAVQRWAGEVDSSPAAVVWLGGNSWVALCVTATLAVITLTIESVLLVRRDARSQPEAARLPQ